MIVRVSCCICMGFFYSLFIDIDEDLLYAMAVARANQPGQAYTVYAYAHTRVRTTCTCTYIDHRPYRTYIDMYRLLYMIYE
jgi:hypothetical protein